MKTKRSLFLTAAFIAGLAAPAQAAMINVMDNGTVKGTLTCTTSASATPPECKGFIGDAPASLSATSADLYDVTPANESSQASFLNSLTGATTSFAAGDATKTEQGGVDTASYQVDALYFLIKLGAGTAFFKNTAGTQLDVAWAKNGATASGGPPPGVGGGLSHETQFGILTHNTSIPTPATLALRGAGLIGLGVFGRRRAMS